MAKNPLQDQLLKAGLVKKHALNQVNSTKRKQARQGEEAPSLAEQALAEKAARDRLLAEQQKEALRQKELAAQIRQLVQSHRVERGQGDVAYNFVDGKSVKKIHVSQALWDQLSYGLAAVVKQGDKYEIVPAKVAEKIQQRDVSVVVSFKAEARRADDDDPYKDYQIPDDLMW
jgi:uncharacterized protein YaiL (DUF2058 family)